MNTNLEGKTVVITGASGALGSAIARRFLGEGVRAIALVDIDSVAVERTAGEAGNNITVNAIAPGPFHTKMMSAILDEKGDEFRANCPMGRLGEPDDMAGIAIYLASRASSYVTGQIIAVDGGFSTAPW
jgi:NAD(P)-dependent dehydrogenase (short-subunit alcohol dehydrogenase family)